jgi:hypothetical protein
VSQCDTGPLSQDARDALKLADGIAPVSQCDSVPPAPPTRVAAAIVGLPPLKPVAGFSITKAALDETPSRQMQECERLAKHILTRFGSEKADILEVARQLRNWRYGGR